MNKKQPSEITVFVANIKNGIWLFGVPSWIFGIVDRSLAALSDGYLSAVDITQLFTAFFFFISWLFLKPISKL
jgi:hypothetical protein